MVALLVASCASSNKTKKDKDEDSDNKKSYPSNLCEIKGIVIEEHDTEWYREQYEGWLKQAEKDPKDEYAWMNCFRAKHYELIFSKDYNYVYADSVETALLNKMEENIPGTYTYYTCAYLDQQMGSQENYKLGKKAFEKIPKEKTFFDYDTWLCFQILFGEGDYHAFAKEFYDSGLYSEELLLTNLNELNCMEEGSIFVGNGDAGIIPKWLIQDGMGKHKDKVLLCYSFFNNPNYCRRIYNELGIGEVPQLQEPRTYEDIDKNIQYLINDISDKSGKTLYFPKHNPDYCQKLWNERGTLYDIGFLYINSPNEVIDIYKEQERFFNSTDFSYLDKPLKKDAWTADMRISSALSTYFYQLMLKYKEDGDTANYQKMHKIMEKAVNRISNTKIRTIGIMYLEKV